MYSQVIQWHFKPKSGHFNWNNNENCDNVTSVKSVYVFVHLVKRFLGQDISGTLQHFTLMLFGYRFYIY